MVKLAEEDKSVGFVSGKVYSDIKTRTLETVGKKTSQFTIVGEHIGAGQKDVGQFDRIQEREYLDDIFILVSKSVVKTVGIYDTDFFLYFEETDWLCRSRVMGFKMLYSPRAIAVHEKSSSTGRGTNPINTYWNSRNSYLFLWKNGTKTQLFTFR